MIIPFDRYVADDALVSARRESALESLRRQRDLIRRIARFNRLGEVAVFGSVARGEETAASDLDLLATPDDDASLFDLARFEIDTEQLTGREVDAISRRALSSTRDANILTEALPP